MKWFNKIKQSFNGAVKGWKGKTFDFTNWMGRTFWGIDNSKLATNETIFSVITRISNTVSILPLKLHKDYEIAHNQSSDVLINEPNQNMNGYDFINKMEVSRNETGNAYAVIFRDIRMRVEQIMPIDPDYVTPFINTDTDELWYVVQGSGGTYYFHNMNMIHVKHITGTSRWQGISPLEVLKNTLDYDKAVQEFSLIEMKKPESFTIEYAANVDEAKRKQVTENFREFYRNNGGILFKEPGVNIERFEKKYLAADILKSEQITRSRVANVFNIPVAFLNDNEGQSFSSNEQAMIQYVQMTITPIVRQYEHEFNRKLLTKDERVKGYYFKFNLGGLMRGDTDTRAKFYQYGIRNGWFKQDEVRMFEDLPPEGGNADKLWISGDLYPIDLPSNERKSAARTIERGDNNEEQEETE